jgi:hypothetical protein
VFGLWRQSPEENQFPNLKMFLLMDVRLLIVVLFALCPVARASSFERLLEAENVRPSAQQRERNGRLMDWLQRLRLREHLCTVLDAWVILMGLVAEWYSPITALVLFVILHAISVFEQVRWFLRGRCTPDNPTGIIQPRNVAEELRVKRLIQQRMHYASHDFWRWTFVAIDWCLVVLIVHACLNGGTIYALGHLMPLLIFYVFVRAISVFSLHLPFLPRRRRSSPPIFNAPIASHSP